MAPEPVRVARVVAVWVPEVGRPEPSDWMVVPVSMKSCPLKASTARRPPVMRLTGVEPLAYQTPLLPLPAPTVQTAELLEA